MGVEKCQGCAYLNPKMYHCGKYLRGVETAMYLCHTEKPQTNADRIRAMTDEELAVVLQEWGCNACDFAGFCEEEEQCKAQALAWLREECKG